jgi:hypothetical protein
MTHFSHRTRHRSCQRLCCSNLNVGWSASRDGGVKDAEKVVQLTARARCWILSKENCRERHFGYRQLRGGSHDRSGVSDPDPLGILG